MARTLGTDRHEALRAYIVKERKKAGLRQIDLAEKLKRNQSYVTDIETGQKTIDVLELMQLADAIGFDPKDAINAVRKVKL